jgi:trans-aconitate methyltransferase
MTAMEGYRPDTYGDRMAGIYDELYAEAFDVIGTVELLVRLAGEGRALELAIGTGRIAVPLAQHGVEVVGIDASQAMVAELRNKPGGRDIVVHVGDFADVDVPGEFSVIFVVFNTFFALTTQEDQIRCFHNVAAHLGDGGLFVIEAFVPDLTRFDRHQRLSVTDVGLDEVQLEASRHDPVRQRVDSQHVFLSREGPRLYPVHLRYAYPPELDLMARLAGLRLRERRGGWRDEPFTSASTNHVSIYERDPARPPKAAPG